MHLLWLTEHYYPQPGGMARSCDRIVHGLRTAGVTVDVVHLTTRLERPRIEAQRGGRLIIYPLASDPAHTLNCLWNLLEQPEWHTGLSHLVAFGGTLPLLAGPVYAAWLGLPLIVLLRGNDFDTAIFSPRRGEYLGEALERAARVCVVSGDKQRKIAALYPQVHVLRVPNGIELERWRPLPSDLQRATERRELAEGRRVLGLFGQIKPKKGGLFFLQQMLASGLAGRFHLLIVGELEPEVAAWLADHPEIHHTLEPFVERYMLLTCYPACDMIVLPSFYDGLPNVLLEAGALGVAPLAAAVAGMADVLEDGVHGLLFPPGDEHGCRRAIARAATLPTSELHRLGEHCRTMVEEQLHSRLETERYLSVFRETIQS